MGMTDEQIKATEGQLIAMTPVKRVAEPNEIAQAVVFLASPDSAFVVGAELVADGGISQL
jgi:NAD(P)-dependent dehydrogenase (short-subunit alcohol dehydrogenase family)